MQSNVHSHQQLLPEQHHHSQFATHASALSSPHQQLSFIDARWTPLPSMLAQTHGPSSFSPPFILLPPPSPKEHHGEMTYVLRAPQMMVELPVPRRPSGIGWEEALRSQLQCWTGLENVQNAFRKRRQVEVVKTGWPHGTTLQVSYLSQWQRWVVSNGKQACLVEEKSKGHPVEGEIGAVASFWMEYVSALKDVEVVKRKLPQLTLCGKISNSWKEVIFDSVIINDTGMELQPFEARDHVEKMGLRFVPIRSLGIFGAHHNLINSLLRAVRSVRGQPCESPAGLFGRAKMYFVRNDGELLGGVCVSTAEDFLLAEMKTVLLGELTASQQEAVVGERVSELSGLLPFPSQSYISLFQALIQLISVLKLSMQQVEEHWTTLPKLCLYLRAKRIPFQKYAHLFLSSDCLQQLSQCSLEQLGPMESKLTLVYYLVHPNPAFQLRLASRLKEALSTLHLHFQIIPQNMNDLHQLKQLVMQGSENINHYFILSHLPISEVKLLDRSLNGQSNHRYFRVVVVSESFGGETVLAENLYPFSWATIINYYAEALANALTLEDKVRRVAEVTHNVAKFKNWEVLGLRNRVSIRLEEMSEGKEVKKAVEAIFERNDRKAYLGLITQLEKSGCKGEDSLGACEEVIKKSYNWIRTIRIKEQ